MNELNSIPQALDVEKALIGHLLMNPGSEINLDLTVDHFSLRSHQILFRTILSMRDSGEAIDAITVTTKLKDLEMLSEVGGASYISSTGIMGLTIRHDSYFEILDEKLRLRKLLDISQKLERDSYQNIESDLLLEDLGNQILNFQKSESSGNMLHSVVKDLKK